MCEQSPFGVCVNVCREVIDFACFGYFQSITQFYEVGVLSRCECFGI